MSNIEHIKAAILAQLPEDGTQMGNRKMQTQLLIVDELKLSEEDYRRACEELVAEGQIARGRGRGGAIRLAEGNAEGGNKSGAAPAGSRGKKKKQRNAAGAASADPPSIGDAAGRYGNYRHDAAAISRPDVGVQAQFNARREPKSYRYDSSLAPELCWDENTERDFVEWLLSLISEAAEKGEAEVFSEEHVWKGTGDRFASLSQCVARLKSLTQPFLNWAGKAERQQISVPTVPLFVHERHSTETILKTLESHRATGTNLDLFGDENEKDIADRLDAYSHTEEWQNRLVLGDSLQVMNSLLEYEGLGGQVQMIYFDPPYGVKFGSNFQPFVRKRDVKHGKDEELIREPEMVKAYRDTWELGLHSYLSYLRDRLLLARELLTESGSVFVQISDENVHHVRELMDEVFSEYNFVSQIFFQKTSGFETKTIATVGDYILWYAKEKSKLKVNKIYKPKEIELGEGNAKWIILPDGSYRGVSKAEARGEQPLPAHAKLYNPADIQSQGAAKEPQPFEMEGRTFKPNNNSHWKANYPDGMERLKRAGRIHVARNSLQYRRFSDDFPFSEYSHIWTDTQLSSFGDEKLYVVQTLPKVIARCMHLASDPGDLVFDPTCGSGTTAYVAEQWGRRWITCDTSRVPLALARQRLLAATFPWYELKELKRGPAGGFVYQRKQNRNGEEVGGLVPRITLKSIANNEDPETVTLVDRPEVKNGITRVCGPFTVEATIQAAHSLVAQAESQASEQAAGYDARTYLDRMIEIVRRSKNLNLPGNRVLKLDGVRPVESEHLHAEAVDESGKRVALMFGPEDGAIHSQQVFDGASEAYFLRVSGLNG
ncbi:site-specific DNA-methyltransferase [Alloalcanivorax profundimaris]|uniref:site-specific DNA-methyltransferase n=1 Tax=Alloalcanivorax profundimaris TaxID=2735259 RepID=UPI0018877EC2|nr:DNA methyltransferase [Alloalcanivorax profundimaris]MBF1802884.1 site-specific DNA-methyltransferase [Alloalcanivorax profundimaris]MCQ6262104.1 site-specific DNA-methyltransferase [Alcanivorax sp. MM125-6]